MIGRLAMDYRRPYISAALFFQQPCLAVTVSTPKFMQVVLDDTPDGARGTLWPPDSPRDLRDASARLDRVVPPEHPKSPSQCGASPDAGGIDGAHVICC